MATKKTPVKATKKETPKASMKVAAVTPPVKTAPAPVVAAAVPAAPTPAPAAAPAVTFEQIKARAYEVWLRKGCPSGQDVQNWEQAERELGVR